MLTWLLMGQEGMAFWKGLENKYYKAMWEGLQQRQIEHAAWLLGGLSKGLVERKDKSNLLKYRIISEFLTGSKNVKVYKGRAVSHLYPHHIPEEREEGWLAIGLNSGYMESCGCFPATLSLWASSVQFSCSVVSNSLWLHEPQHARPACPSPTPGVYSSLMSIASVMPSSHLTLCRPLLLLPSVFPSISVFSNVSALHISWPKDWSFSFKISPSNEHPGLVSFRMDWLGLLAVQGTLESLLQHHSSKASILQCSAFFTVQLTCIHDHWKNHSLA